MCRQVVLLAAGSLTGMTADAVVSRKVKAVLLVAVGGRSNRRVGIDEQAGVGGHGAAPDQIYRVAVHVGGSGFHFSQSGVVGFVFSGSVHLVDLLLMGRLVGPLICFGFQVRARSYASRD